MYGTPRPATLEAALEKKRGPWATVALTELGKPWGDYGLNQAFKRARKRAGLSGWTFRDLRHLFVTELFRNGASARAIQMLAGNADLATAQIYADLDASNLRSVSSQSTGSRAMHQAGNERPGPYLSLR